jgi:hypothetical protein
MKHNFYINRRTQANDFENKVLKRTSEFRTKRSCTIKRRSVRWAEGGWCMWLKRGMLAGF